MPRPPRVQVAGAMYHVTANGARGGFLFPTANHRDVFEDVLMIALPAAQFECHAYALLGTHYHLLLRTTEANLGVGMKRLNWLYAWRLNRSVDLRGHAFASRYGAKLVETDEHLLSTVRYIALNPVEAGLCASPLAWPWSSYAAMVGKAPRPEFLTINVVLRAFDDRPAIARRLLRRFVEELPLAAAA